MCWQEVAAAEKFEFAHSCSGHSENKSNPQLILLKYIYRRDQTGLFWVVKICFNGLISLSLSQTKQIHNYNPRAGTNP